MIWLLSVACTGPPKPHGPVDTGLPIDPCLVEPCVQQVEHARHEASDDYPATLGYALGAHGDTVWVGAPAMFGEGPPYVERLSLPDLKPTGRWEGYGYGVLGMSIAARDIDGDGVAELLLGDGNYTERDIDGAIYLLAGDAEGGDVADQADLMVTAPPDLQLGFSVALASVGVSGVELVASGPGTYVREAEGGVYAFDPGLTGRHDISAASRSIRGEAGFGEVLTVWDADADGQQDLVVKGDSGVAWFLGPWQGNLREDDAQGLWIPRALEDGLGTRLSGASDLTGDGAADLLLAAPNHEEPEVRAGRAYVVTAADLETQPADDLPIQVRGTEVGHGMGYGLASADIDGDGQPDLVVAASGVTPGNHTGEVLVYFGPVAPGVLEPQDAAIVVYGDYVNDLFGRSVAAVDADGDDQEDLVVGSQKWPAGQGRGAVHLLLGADLWP